MKNYNKPTVEIVKIKAEEFITLSVASQGNEDNEVGIWDLPTGWTL